jgi:hypothetical protein
MLDFKGQGNLSNQHSDDELENMIVSYLEQWQKEEQALSQNPEPDQDEEEHSRQLEMLRMKIDNLREFLAKLRGQETLSPEEERLRHEIEADSKRGLIAMDTVYALYRPDIHRFDKGEGSVQEDKLVIKRKSGKLSIQIPLPGFDQNEDSATTGDDESKRELAMVAVTEVARAALGDYAARVMHLLFEIANDYPHWRNPNITFSVNEFLDRLGYARDKRGIHYSKNRRYLMRTLAALAATPIAAERPVYDKGKEMRMVIIQALITSIRTLYDNDEEANASLSTWELFERGVAGDIMQVSIGQDWYEGVRRRDGSRGNNYTLVPRVGNPKLLANPIHTRTEDRLENYLYTRCKELKYSKLNISILRSTAMEKAGITTKNVTRATQILQKALDKLQDKGIIISYGPVPLPIRPIDSINVELNENEFYQRRRHDEKKI